jgi:hypothetical protein
MPELEATPVLFEVYCGRCGAGLCNNTSVSMRRHMQAVNVEPCENCLRAEWDGGFNEGYAKAEKEAHV